MAGPGGSILENLSGRKLAIIVSVVLFIQLLCFLLGGVIGKWMWMLSLLYYLIVKLVDSDEKFIITSDFKPHLAFELGLGVLGVIITDD